MLASQILIYGGQRGNPPASQNQLDTFPNSRITGLGNVEVSSALPTLEGPVKLNPRVREAACWLYLNGKPEADAVIPFLRRKFALTNLEAIEAAKAAHTLEYPEGAR